MTHLCPPAGRRNTNRLATALALCLIGACSDSGAGTERTEILQELRALRSAITDNQHGQRPHDLDRQQLDAAMQPLREMLQGLVTDQSSLRDRQATLASELGRWSGLLATSASAEAKEELTALRSRLEKMEQELRQQDARHRDVQELLRKALDTTADRLGDFLLRLEGKTTPGSGGAAPAEPGKGAIDPGAAPAPAGNGTNPARTDWLRPGYERRGSGGELLTILLLVLGIIAAGLLAWRLWREGAAHRQQPAQELAPVGPGARAMTEPNTGWDAVELLAASLADHVERVETATRVVERRHPQPATAPEPQPAPGSEETIVLANEDEAVWQLLGVAAHAPATPQEHQENEPHGQHDESQQFAQPALPAVLPAEVPPRAQTGGDGPVWLAAEVALDGEDAARAWLVREMRVLRRPEPVFTRQSDHLRVEVAVLPGLPAAERAQILQRLLRAVPRAPGKNGSRNSSSL